MTNKFKVISSKLTDFAISFNKFIVIAVFSLIYISPSSVYAQYWNADTAKALSMTSNIYKLAAALQEEEERLKKEKIYWGLGIFAIFSFLAYKAFNGDRQEKKNFYRSSESIEYKSIEKKKNTFIGEKSLANDAYKIYLLDFYSITKNDVLSKFICDEKIFESVDDALEYAHEKDKRNDEELNNLEIERKERAKAEAMVLFERQTITEEYRLAKAKENEDVNNKKINYNWRFIKVGAFLVFIILITYFFTSKWIENNAKREALEVSDVLKIENNSTNNLTSSTSNFAKSKPIEKSLALINSAIQSAYVSNWDQVDSHISNLELLIKAPIKGDRKSSRMANAEGLAYLKSENYSAAIQSFDRGLSLDDSDVEVKNNLAYALIQANQYDKAESVLMNLLAEVPRRTSAWSNLSETLASSDIKRSISVLKIGVHFSASREKTLAYLNGQSESNSNENFRKVIRAVLTEISSIPMLSDTKSEVSNVKSTEILRDREASTKNCQELIYPSYSRARGEEGRTTLNFVITKEATLKDLQVASSSGFVNLDEASKTAVRTCTLVPKVLNGKLVDSYVTLVFSWKLN